MLMKIRNNKIHLIHLKSGVIGSYKTVTAEITEEEIEKFQDKITIWDSNPEKKEQKKQTIETKKDILNDSTINDYLERSTRTVLNSIDEDKDNFSEKDLDLMLNYESDHKNRQKVIDKINNIKGGG